MIHFNNNCKVDPTLGVSVFAEVRPDGGTASLSVCQEIPSENAFRHFMDSLLSAARQRGVYPDNWIFQYDMPAGRRAVAAVRETNGRFTDFHRFMRRAGIAPIRILSLRDAAYCQEQDIDCLSPEGLRGRLMTDPAYRRFLDSDRIYAGHQTPDTLRTTRAIDIGAGMLLYDLRHPIGREAYKSFMQHCADHFFEQELNGLDKISLYDIHCFFDPETYLSKLGALNFNPVYFGRNFRLDNLNGKMLFDRTMRYEGIFLKEYDMGRCPCRSSNSSTANVSESPCILPARTSLFSTGSFSKDIPRSARHPICASSVPRWSVSKTSRNGSPAALIPMICRICNDLPDNGHKKSSTQNFRNAVQWIQSATGRIWRSFLHGMRPEIRHGRH